MSSSPRPALVTLFALLAGGAPAHAASPKSRDPVACFARTGPSKGATLWLASNPHLPLGETKDGSLSTPAEAERCKTPGRWGTIGRVYRVLDRWGKDIGESKVARRVRYDVSKCDEIEMAGAEGAQGTHLLVAADGAWRPGASFADAPSAAMRASFERFLSGLDERLVAGKPFHTQPAKDRVAFFHIGAHGCTPSDDEAKTVGSYAAAGGPYLVIARYDAKHGWRAVYISTPPPAVSDDYREATVLAVVDMDDDGIPEVVAHQAEDTAFWDIVLALDSFHVWTEVAHSASGGTL